MQLNDDVYVPLEYFEKVLPVRFTYDKAARTLSAQLPSKTLKIPVLNLPPMKPGKNDFSTAPQMSTIIRKRAYLNSRRKRAQ